MAMEINVTIDGNFEECPEVRWLRSVAERVLTAHSVTSSAELGLVITTQKRVRELNRSYRGVDKPTDVLAFYMTSATEETGAEPPSFVTPPDGVLHLGEVIISYPQAVLQAKEHQHSLKKEIAILIVHGVLHLLGHDHDKPEPGRRMRAREREILRQIIVDKEENSDG
jgi:probable rRNA maturation factor